MLLELFLPQLEGFRELLRTLPEKTLQTKTPRILAAVYDEGTYEGENIRRLKSTDKFLGKKEDDLKELLLSWGVVSADPHKGMKRVEQALEEATVIIRAVGELPDLEEAVFKDVGLYKKWFRKVANLKNMIFDELFGKRMSIVDNLFYKSVDNWEEGKFLHKYHPGYLKLIHELQAKQAAFSWYMHEASQLFDATRAERGDDMNSYMGFEGLYGTFTHTFGLGGGALEGRLENEEMSFLGYPTIPTDMWAESCQPAFDKFGQIEEALQDLRMQFAWVKSMGENNLDKGSDGYPSSEIMELRAGLLERIRDFKPVVEAFSKIVEKKTKREMGEEDTVVVVEDVDDLLTEVEGARVKE